MRLPNEMGRSRYEIPFVDGGAQPASLSELMAKGGGDAAAQAVEAELQRVQAGGRCAEPVEISFGPAREFTRRVHMRSIADQAGKGGSVVLFVTDTNSVAAPSESTIPKCRTKCSNILAWIKQK